MSINLSMFACFIKVVPVHGCSWSSRPPIYLPVIRIILITVYLHDEHKYNCMLFNHQLTCNHQQQYRNQFNHLPPCTVTTNYASCATDYRNKLHNCDSHLSGSFLNHHYHLHHYHIHHYHHHHHDQNLAPI